MRLRYLPYHQDYLEFRKVPQHLLFPRYQLQLKVILINLKLKHYL